MLLEAWRAFEQGCTSRRARCLLLPPAGVLGCWGCRAVPRPACVAGVRLPRPRAHASPLCPLCTPPPPPRPAPTPPLPCARPLPRRRPAEERERAVGAVEGKMPRRVKRKRPIVLDDGSRPGGFEEYYDFIFPVGPGCGLVGRALQS